MSSFGIRIQFPDDYEMCEHCVGSGKEADGRKCTRCGGQGVLRSRRIRGQDTTDISSVSSQPSPTSYAEALRDAIEAKQKLLVEIDYQISKSYQDAAFSQPMQLPYPLSQSTLPADPEVEARYERWREQLRVLQTWVNGLDPEQLGAEERVASKCTEWRPLNESIWMCLSILESAGSRVQIHRRYPEFL